MNENHQRHLLATFQYVDNLLSEADRILASAGSPSPFQEYSQDSTPVQRKVTHDYILRVREMMRRILEEFEIPLKPPLSGALWAVRNHLAFAAIAIVEVEPKYMLGYGKLSDEDSQRLDKSVAELNTILKQVSLYLAQGIDADLRTRLQRLEQTKDEVKLLRVLERIITAHGLVEFRAMLAFLLERLETNTFEIGVFGRVSSGKSSFLNHLLGGEFLPVGVTPVTAVPSRINFGLRPQATIEFAESRPQTVELSQLAEFSTEQQNPGNARHVTGIRVQVPAKRLREGVTFVDTPGLGSLATAGGEETIAYLPRCDLGIVLLDAGTALTQEDLVVIQLLYRAGATAMVLISKVDLLAPSDRKRMSTYVQQHLRSELNLDLQAYPISVVGTEGRLCDEWFEQELKPLLELHRENAAASLKRKIGGLREAVECLLETRLESARHPVASQPRRQLKEAEASLRNADVMFSVTQQTGREIVGEIPSMGGKIIEAAANDIAAAWAQNGGTPLNAAEMFSATANRILAEQSARCLNLFVELRRKLDGILQSAQQASQTMHELEALSKADGLPLIDFASVARAVSLKRPLFLGFLGKSILRNYIGKRLKEHTAGTLPEFLNLAGNVLRRWHQTKLTELEKTFAANAGIYRARFERLSDTTKAESDIQEDLDILKEWSQSAFSVSRNHLLPSLDTSSALMLAVVSCIKFLSSF